MKVMYTVSVQELIDLAYEWMLDGVITEEQGERILQRLYERQQKGETHYTTEIDVYGR